eukprot:7316944-Alexandrium_andersonii.AAC.1
MAAFVAACLSSVISRLAFGSGATSCRKSSGPTLELEEAEEEPPSWARTLNTLCATRPKQA